MNHAAWFFFLALVVLETLADIYAKHYGNDPRWYSFTTSLLFYLVANAAWLIAMRCGMKLWRGVVIFGVAQAATGVLVGLANGRPYTGPRYTFLWQAIYAERA